MEGAAGGAPGLPSSECSDRDRWRPSADWSESQFSPAAPWEKSAFLTHASHTRGPGMLLQHYSRMKDVMLGGRGVWGGATDKKMETGGRREAGQGNNNVG